MNSTDKIAVIERLLANRGLRIVRHTIETVRIGPDIPSYTIPAYNQHVYILNTDSLPPDTYVESDTNSRRYHVYGAVEGADTMDEFSGATTIFLNQTPAVFGPRMNKVYNIVFARVVSGAV